VHLSVRCVGCCCWIKLYPQVAKVMLNSSESLCTVSAPTLSTRKSTLRKELFVSKSRPKDKALRFSLHCYRSHHLLGESSVWPASCCSRL
jgi:hypothetical protein